MFKVTGRIKLIVALSIVAVSIPLTIVVKSNLRSDEYGKRISSQRETKMGELKFLEEYSGQTVDEIIELEREYRIDSLVLAIEQALYQKAYAVGEDKLSDTEKLVLAIEGLEREVNNGGYSQFFINSSVEFAPIIVDSLEAIGCPKTAEITQTAIDALGISKPITIEKIQEIIYDEDEVRDEKLNECDNLYFDNDEPIADRLFEFIKMNRAKVVLQN